jgi:hypothetical protein
MSKLFTKKQEKQLNAIVSKDLDCTIRKCLQLLDDNEKFPFQFVELMDGLVTSLKDGTVKNLEEMKNNPAIEPNDLETIDELRELFISRHFTPESDICPDCRKQLSKDLRKDYVS